MCDSSFPFNYFACICAIDAMIMLFILQYWIYLFGIMYMQFLLFDPIYAFARNLALHSLIHVQLIGYNLQRRARSLKLYHIEHYRHMHIATDQK